MKLRTSAIVGDEVVCRRDYHSFVPRRSLGPQKVVFGHHSRLWSWCQALRHNRRLRRSPSSDVSNEINHTRVYGSTQTDSDQQGARESRATGRGVLEILVKATAREVARRLSGVQLPTKGGYVHAVHARHLAGTR